MSGMVAKAFGVESGSATRTFRGCNPSSPFIGVFRMFSRTDADLRNGINLSKTTA